MLNNVETLNRQLAATEREIALLAIEQKLAEIGIALDQVKADDHLRNKALLPIKKLKITVAGLSSIPKIRYLSEQAGLLLDTAMDAIAAAQKQPPSGVKELSPGNQRIENPATQTPVTLQKPVKVIRAQALSAKTYLETAAEVDDYLARLRQALLAVLHEGKKVRID